MAQWDQLTEGKAQHQGEADGLCLRELLPARPRSRDVEALKAQLDAHGGRWWEGQARESALKATILVDSERPKVSESEVVSMLKKSGMEYSTAKPAFGVVVGGDGLFSYQGRQLGIPLLFVGTKSRRPTDSKARLAEVYLTGLECCAPAR